jgi:hypothetical protein
MRDTDWTPSIVPGILLALTCKDLRNLCLQIDCRAADLHARPGARGCGCRDRPPRRPLVAGDDWPE